MDCSGCKSNILSVEDLCFYYMNETSVHLIVKPEKTELLEDCFEIAIATKNRKRDITCKKCKAGLGKKLPIGPSDFSPLTFGNCKVILFGKTLAKKEQWYNVYKQTYNVIPVREEFNFFEKVQITSPSKRIKVQEDHGNIIFPDPHGPTGYSAFKYDDTLKSDRTPYPYQVEAYIEALQKDLIVVLPTGRGKTLIASLVTAKMIEINDRRMVLFIVDRIPLVFQQGEAISTDTQLEVCALTSENNTYRKRTQLVQGDYQVLVATAGAYVALEKELGMERFCYVILDECHHATKGHIYVQILESIRSCDYDNRPRVLGLTASPPSVRGSLPGTVSSLSEFKSLFFDAPICHNLLESSDDRRSDVDIREIPEEEDQSLLKYQKALKDELGRLAQEINDAFGSTIIRAEYWHNDVRNRSNLTRVLHHLNCHSNEVIDKNVKSMLKIFNVLENTELLGVTYANKILEEMEFYRTIDATEIYSPRVSFLLEILRDHNRNSKIIVFVKTRKIAQILSTILKNTRDIDDKFSPLKIVGQYGPLGMSWEREQDEIIRRFREGNCNLLVSTSVLEEGQDIPTCNVVIRFDGIKTLISYKQSKGRARDKDSEFILILSKSEHKLVIEIQKEENSIRDVLNSHFTDVQVPSQLTKAIYEEIHSNFTRTNQYDKVIRSSECAVEFYLIGTYTLLDLQDSIANFFREKYFIKLSHIDVKSGAKWNGRGIFPEKDTLLTLGLQTYSGGIYERYKLLTVNWNFELETFSDNIWTKIEIHPSDERKKIIMNRRWGVSEIFWGSFKDRGRFLMGQIEKFDKGATFELDEYYLIIRTQENVIEIPMMSIHHFILAEWTDKKVTLFLPLTHPPKVHKGSHRVTSLTCPALQHFGDYPVFGIALPYDNDNWSELWIQLHTSTIFPVPLFESRVELVESQPMETGQICLSNNTNFWDRRMQNCVWQYSILKENRNVCLTMDIFTAITAEISQAPLTDLVDIEQALIALLFKISQKATIYFYDLVETFKKKLTEIRDSENKGDRFCKKNYCYIECAIVTPSRVIPLSPILTQCNRLFRKYPDERFLNLAFRDENEGELDTKVLDEVDDSLKNGKVINGVKFYFIVCSSSQLRSKRSIFIQTHDLNEEEVNLKIKKMRFELIGESNITNETRFLSRLGLFCTSDKPTCEIQELETECLLDIRAEDNLLLTDGAGKIKKSFAINVLKDYGSKDTVDTASALQIRLAGLKGVFTIVDDDDTDLRNRKIIYRESMKKIQWTHSTLCIVKVGKYNKLCLNIQMLNLLTSLEDANGEWDPRPRIRELHKKEMSGFAKIFVDFNHARAELGHKVPKLRAALDQNVFDVLCEPYFLKLLRCIYTYNIHNLIEKVHIPIPLSDGCILMGIPDPVGVLEDGEVYITYIEKENGQEKQVVKEGRILIYKNPCLHPGDLLTPLAVNRPELHDLHNVIVFPIRGKTSIPACSGGGDLDGDEFAVIWDEALIPPESAIFPPQNYDEIANKALEELADRERQENIEAKKPVQDDPDIVNRLTEGYHRIISNDLLGKIAHIHLSVCDQKPDGARDPLAIELSEKASLAVDSPKTGIIPEIPSVARKMIREKGYPDFMEKSHTDFFISTKLLGDLYHSAKEVCYKNSEWVNVLNYFDDKHRFKGGRVVPGNFQLSSFKIPGYENYMEDALLRYSEYSSSFQQIMLAFGIETESEVVTALIIGCHPLLTADKGKTMSALAVSFEHLTEEFRERFHRDTPTADYRKKAAAWYMTVYSLAHKGSEQFVLHSFAWIMPEYLKDIVPKHAGNIRFKSEGQVFSAIGKSGKKYLLEKGETIRANVDLKLSILPLVENAINTQSDLIETAEEQPKLFHVVPFGSASVYLCELESDLDISVKLTQLGEDILFPDKDYLNSLKNNLTKYRKQILSTYISPKISEIADNKSDKMEVAVPVISFTMKPDKKELPEVNVDITVESDGVFKNDYIRQLYVETGGIFFIWLWLLVHWARHVGILKCHNSPDSSGIILTAEFEALLLFIYDQMENKPNQVMYGEEDYKLESLLTSIDGQNIDHILGAMLEEFFHLGHEITSKATGDIIYTWPVEGDPTHTIYESALKQISALLFQGWHCLVFTRDVTKLFERAQKQFHVNHRFSHRMSEKIKMSIEFYRKSLSDISGAKIDFQIMGSNVLLTGYGSAEALLTLSAEMSALEADTALSKRYKSNANRYMMDGCVTMAVENSTQDCTIKLRSFDGCFKPSHINNEKSVVVPEGKEMNKEWRKNGIGKIKTLLSKQLEKFPNDDTNLLKKLQLKTRFGFFYVLDGRATVDNTGSLPLDQFMKSLEEGIKRRKDPEEDVDKISISDSSEKSQDIPIPSANEKQDVKQKPKKSNAKPGLNCAFCPGINTVNSPEEAERMMELYKVSLLTCRFQRMNKDASYTWRVDMQVSALREVRFNLDANLEILDFSERPIIWLLATIIGDRRVNKKAHDVRLRAESAKTLALDSPLCKSILVECRGSSLFTVREDGSPLPCETVKQRLRFIKLNLETFYYERDDSIAKISFGKEYGKDDNWSYPRYYCELSMYHSGKVLADIVAAGNGNIQIQDLADRAIKLSLAVSERIKENPST